MSNHGGDGGNDNMSTTSSSADMFEQEPPIPDDVHPVLGNLRRMSIEHFMECVRHFAAEYEQASFAGLELIAAEAKGRFAACREAHAAYLARVPDDHNLEPDTALYRHLSGNLSKVQRLLVKAKEKEHREQQDTHTASTSRSGRARPTLPTIELRPFHGDTLLWSSWLEQFLNLVGNDPSMSDGIKHLYLRSSLKGEAEKLLHGIPQDSPNYKIALDVLRQRYGRTRALVARIVNQIIESPSIDRFTLEPVKRLMMTFRSQLSALRAQGVDTQNPLLLAMVECKLPEAERIKWDLSVGDADIATPDEFLEFLQRYVQTLEAMSISNGKSSKPSAFGSGKSSKFAKPKSRSDKKPGHSSIPTAGSFAATTSDHRTYACHSCGSNDHQIRACKTFRAKSVSERWQHIKDKKLCHNCLYTGHGVATCMNKGTCIMCGERHNTLLHYEKGRPAAGTSVSAATFVPERTDPVTASYHASSTFHPVALLPSAMVRLETPTGHSIITRAYIDACSQRTFMSSRLSQKLGIPTGSEVMDIGVVGGTRDGYKERPTHDIGVGPVDRSHHSKWTRATVLNRVTIDMAPTRFHRKDWPHIEGLKLADPDFCKGGPVDLLLSVHFFADCLTGGKITGPPGAPHAFATVFGYVLFGGDSFDSPAQLDSHPVHSSLAVSCHAACDTRLQALWEHDNCPEYPGANHSAEERAALKHFEASTKFDGRKITMELPIKVKDPFATLGSTLNMAERRFSGLIRRFSTNKVLEKEYSSVIQEYFDLGHAEPVPPDEIAKPAVYMPHHGVFKDSTSTHLRVVFDASARSSTGQSLNDVLVNGPKLQEDLVIILTRWRSYQTVVNTDITKMYRAVHLDPAQRDLHRFLWRQEGSTEPAHFRMTRLTFGVKPCQSMAIYALQETARHHKNTHPLAFDCLMKNFNVDDGLAGADSPEQVKELIKQLDFVTKAGGFQLAKFSSNSLPVLDTVPPDQRDSRAEQMLRHDHDSMLTIETEATPGSKVLGIRWSPAHDVLSFRFSDDWSWKDAKSITKCQMLSEIASLYDPLGLLSPVSFLAKTMFQTLWGDEGLGWDDPIPNNVYTEFRKWREELPMLCALSFSRFLPAGLDGPVTWAHHFFCDASELGYAAVHYVRCEDAAGNVVVRLVAARTRLAPRKTVSIPRLELCGARLAVTLMTGLQAALPDGPRTFWTDSATVLAWIRGGSKRWQPFVGNRVTAILDASDPTQWRHVPGKVNPADVPSRGTFPSDLIRQTDYLGGPAWLQGPAEAWPKLPDPTYSSEATASIDAEARRVILGAATVRPVPVLRPDDFSTLGHLLRVTAYVRRFLRSKGLISSTTQFLGAEMSCSRLYRYRGRPFSHSLSLSPATRTVEPWEIKEAFERLVLCEQQDAFAADIAALQHNEEIPHGSSLLHLRPFLDPTGLLRVGGRLEAATDLTPDQRHPIVLPKCALSRLLLQQSHMRLQHGPQESTIALANEHAWVIGARPLARRLIHDCRPCRRQRAQLQHPLMAPLPATRVLAGSPFEATGVDLAGPLYIRQPGEKAAKSYVAIFTCFKVRAVHLELVSSASTPDFLMCLRRFVARRGRPTTIHSDRGLNFVGAQRELAKIFSGEGLQTLLDATAREGITWRFNAPRAPHHGGVWEIMVRLMKAHLRRILGKQSLDFEQLTTILCDVEAALNSRPLIPVSPDPGDFDALTPGHFLIHRKLISIPDRPAKLTAPPPDGSVRLRKRWLQVQRITSHFWQRWTKEYLSTLQRRQKWLRPTRPLAVGDLCLLQMEHQPRAVWPLARVIKVHPGSDGQVRTVDIQTPTGSYTRPVVKLALLESALDLPVPDQASSMEAVPVQDDVVASPPLRHGDDVRGGTETSSTTRSGRSYAKT